MRVNIKEVIEFFDDSNFDNKGDVSSIVSIMGEDLNATTFKHYLESEKGFNIEILDRNVTEGHKKGKWLDRWIVDHTNKILYQCEIKSWSSTAIGGKVIPFDASESEIIKISEYHKNKQIRDNYSSESIFPNGTSKVLLKMKKPEGFEDYKLEPLLSYWMVVSFDKNPLVPFSQIDLVETGIYGKTEFKTLTTFSVSLYLRSLKQDYLDLNMPNTERRIKQLDRVLS